MAARKSKKTKATKLKKPDPESLKSTEDEFRGGLPVDLNRIIDGQPLHKKLKHDISTWLENELRSQSERIEKLSGWNRQYRGAYPERTWPYEGAANCAIPLTRTLTDAISVRIFDVIFSQVKTFVVKVLDKDFVDFARQLEEGIDWWVKGIVKLKKKLFSPLQQGIKTGTGIALLKHERKKRPVYRYATPDEKEDKNIKKYRLGNGELGVKMIITEYEGPNVYPISREDLVISSDATNLQDAFLVGYRTYLRKPEIQSKINQGFYYEGSLDKLTAPDEIDETKKERAEDQGMEIQSEEKGKYAIWRLWVKYDVDDDGEEDDIEISWHHPTGTIMRAIYNPLFYGFRPIKEFKFNPIEYRFDGEGTCEILEPVQLEINSQHNQRLDRLNQTIAPGFLVAESSDIEDFEYYPGVIRRTGNPAEDLREIQVSTAPIPSTVVEENMLVQYGKESLGISPEVLGQPTAERPVAREAIARLQESNKKFKFGIDNIRDDLSEFIMMAVELFAQYQPNYTYYIEEKGGYEKKAIDFPFEYIRDLVKVEVAASSELMNQEIRREINLVLYQMLSDYMTNLAGMAQAIVSPETPSDFKKFLINASMLAEKIMERIVRDYNQPDAEDLVMNIAESINVEKAIMNSIDLLPPEQQAQMRARIAQGGQQQPTQIPTGTQ